MKTLPTIEEFFSTHYPDVEITFIDDWSRDTTLRMLEEYKRESKLLISIISYTTNMWKGYAVKKWMEKQSAKKVLMMDADLATDLSMVKEILKVDADVVIWNRVNEMTHRHNDRKFLGKIANFLTRVFLNLKLKDTQAWFKLYRNNTQFLREEVKLNRWWFDFEFLYLAQKKWFNILEMPILRIERKESKVMYRHYLTTLCELLYIKLIH